MRLRSHARPTGRVGRGQREAVHEAAASGEDKQPVLGFEGLSPCSRGQRGQPMRRLRLATRNRLPTRRRATSWGSGRRARQSPEPGAGVVAGQAADPDQSERRSQRQAGPGRASGAPPQTGRQTPRLASPQPERRPARNASKAGRAPSRGPAWSQGKLQAQQQNKRCSSRQAAPGLAIRRSQLACRPSRTYLQRLQGWACVS